MSIKRINGNYHLPTYQRDNYGPYKSEIYQGQKADFTNFKSKPILDNIVAVPIFAVEVGDIGQGLGQDNTGDVSEVCEQCCCNGATVKIDIQNIFGFYCSLLIRTEIDKARFCLGFYAILRCRVSDKFRNSNIRNNFYI